MIVKTGLAPDLRQSVAYTLRLTLIHNWLAIGCLLLVGFLLFWSLYKPSRKKLLAIIGFSLLLLDFEYQKHFLDSLKKQTLDSLTTVNPHYRFQWFVDRFLTKGLPIIFYVLAGISFGLVIISLFFRHKRK